MSQLAQMPIRIEPSARNEPPMSSDELGGVAAAILAELVALLERFDSSESPAAIDLLGRPMSPQDRAELRRVLGEGEVRATAGAAGLSRIRGTRAAGVWWVERYNQGGRLIADLLEVGRVPGILSSAPDEISADMRDRRLSRS